MMDKSSVGNSPEMALSEFQREMRMKGLDVENIHRYTPDVIKGRGVRYLCADAALDWVVSDQIADTSFIGVPVVREVPIRGTSYGFIRCADLRTRP